MAKIFVNNHLREVEGRTITAAAVRALVDSHEGGDVFVQNWEKKYPVSENEEIPVTDGTSFVIGA